MDHSPDHVQQSDSAPQTQSHPSVDGNIHAENLSQNQHSEESQPPAPSLEPIPRGQQLPFYRRNPLTIAFVLLIALVYWFTSAPNGLNSPTQLAVAVGGFYPPAVQAGEWWRFITATLLHAHPGHLFNNAIGLLIFGNLLESVIGSIRLFWLYVVSAFAGLALSYVMLPDKITLGASTIDYGLIGCYVALILLYRYQYERQAFFHEFRGALLFILMFVVWNTMESATVNLWGHIGGLIGGILFASLLWLSRSKKTSP